MKPTLIDTHAPHFIKRGGGMFVDTTKFLHRLVSTIGSKMFFLHRPRIFGGSNLLSRDGVSRRIAQMPTVEELEVLFREGKVERLGMGSRRACYMMPGNGKLCIKCYKSDAEILEGKDPGRPNSRPLAAAAAREIKRCRFDERRNTCCGEYRYWKNIANCAPPELLAAFPSFMAMLKLPSRGWCLVEEFMANEDGTPIEKFHPAWKAEVKTGRMRLAAALDSLEGLLVSHSILFFDPQTVMVQRTCDGFRLRIPDFEPVTRTLIPLETFFPALVRRKIRRRFARFRKAVGMI